MDSSPPYIDDVADRSVISKKEERNEYVKEEPGVAAPSRELDLPKVLEFGRSLFQLSMEIGIDTNGANGKILRVRVSPCLIIFFCFCFLKSS